MLKETAIAHFGSMAEVARALKITIQAVSNWGEFVPEGRAYQLQVLTKGALKTDVNFYEKKTPERTGNACVA